MKQVKKIEKIIFQEEIEKVWCNKCSKEIMNGAGKPSWSDGMYCLRFQTVMTYGSPRDGDVYEYHLCYDCFDKIIDGFEIKPDIKRNW